MGNALNGVDGNEDLTLQDVAQPMLEIIEKLNERGVFNGLPDDDGNPMEEGLDMAAIREQIEHNATDDPVAELDFGGGVGSFHQLQAQQTQLMNDLGPDKMRQIMDAAREIMQQPDVCDTMAKFSVAANKGILEQFKNRCDAHGMPPLEIRRRMNWFLRQRASAMSTHWEWIQWMADVKAHLNHDPFMQNAAISDCIAALEADPNYGEWDLPVRPGGPVPEHEQVMWDRAWADPVPEDVPDLREDDLPSETISILLRYAPYTFANE